VPSLLSGAILPHLRVIVKLINSAERELNVRSNQESAGIQRFVIMIMKLFSRSVAPLCLASPKFFMDGAIELYHEELRELNINRIRGKN